MAALRDEIIANRLPPGASLPPRTELIARLGSTSATVQHAIDILRRDGFVYTNGTRGTFVSPHLPHLCRFAMVFHSSRITAHWNRLYQQFINEASAYNGESNDPRCIEIHFGVENHLDDLALKLLIARTKAHSLAGIIAPESPFETGLARTSLGTAPGLPRVALAGVENALEHWGLIQFGPWYETGIRHLAAAGCRRIAILAGHPTPADLENELAGYLRQYGLESRPHWFLTAPLSGPSCARNPIHLLLDANQRERPDGLLITNDTLAEDAIAGVVASGIRVPEQLRIVAHCNFPWPTPSAVPVTRIGYETRNLLTACLDELAAQRQGAAPGKRLVEATFEKGSGAQDRP